MAPELKMKVPDLMLTGRRNREECPLDRVQTMIAGERLTGLSHGGRDMPVWGPIFSQDISDRDYELRIYSVAKYVEGLQK